MKTSGHWVLVITLLVVFTTSVHAQFQGDDKVFLIGNLADVEDKNAYSKNLFSVLNRDFSLLILGDLFDRSSSGEDTLQTTHLLRSIAGLPGSKIIILPGDRDWDHSGREGFKNVKKLEKYVGSLKLENLIWPVTNGCPGLIDIPLGDEAVLVAINSQWWNHPYEKPYPENSECKFFTTKEFRGEIKDFFQDYADKNILFAGHHPIISHGEKAGYYPLSKWVLPVPLIAGLKSSFHQNVGDDEDLANPRISAYRNQMRTIITDQRPFLYVSAHERNTSILQTFNSYLINAGNPEGKGYIRRNKNQLYRSETPSLVALTFSGQSVVVAETYNYSDRGFQLNKEYTLNRFPCEKEGSPCYSSKSKYQYTNPKPSAVGDSATTAAGSEYKARILRKMMLGPLYRKSWSEPVKVPFLNMDTTFGGLTPTGRGGSAQTVSLRMTSASGDSYVFRSVNKRPELRVAFQYRNTIIADLVKEFTASAEPYGALVVAPLLEVLGIPHASPNLYVMPDDPKLGEHREEFAYLLGFLEERPVKVKSGELGPLGAAKVHKSSKMISELYEDQDHEVDYREYIKARLIDLLIGDYDRNASNWKWLGFEKGKGRIYRPYPRDRDHAFPRYNGLFPWLQDREWVKPSGDHFDSKPDVRSTMLYGNHMDRLLTSKATLSDWSNAASEIVVLLSDSVITAAVCRLPEAAYEIDGPVMIKHLINRRDRLVADAEKYYRDIARQVDVVGSFDDEYFHAVRNSDGSVELNVHNNKKGKPGNKHLYQRTFLPNETKEIRLFGMKGKDYFNIEGDAGQSILIRVVPGTGKDVIQDDSKTNGKFRTKLYSKELQKDEVSTESNLKLMKVKNLDAFRYDHESFKYGTYFPIPYLSSNKDDGLSLNLGVSFTKQAYGKPNYASRHSLSGNVTTRENFAFNYSGKWRQAVGMWDLLFSTFVGNPVTFNFFFGTGNESIKSDSLTRADFYDTRYNTIQFKTGLSKELWMSNPSNVQFTLGYEKNSDQKRTGNIFTESPEVFRGTNSLSMIKLTGAVNLDFRDRVSFSTKGMRFYASYMSGVPLDGTEVYGVFKSTIEQYISVGTRLPLTLALKGGGSWSHNEVPFYDLVYLGQGNNLRGFRRHRFTGENTLFLNSELLWQLFQIQTNIVPVKIGLTGFIDVGRVFVNGENSNKVHAGYGGGFYIVPLQEQFLLKFVTGYSEEEKAGLFLFSIGKLF